MKANVSVDPDYSQQLVVEITGETDFETTLLEMFQYASPVWDVVDNQLVAKLTVSRS